MIIKFKELTKLFTDVINLIKSDWFVCLTRRVGWSIRSLLMKEHQLSITFSVASPKHMDCKSQIQELGVKPVVRKGSNLR